MAKKNLSRNLRPEGWWTNVVLNSQPLNSLSNWMWFNFSWQRPVPQVTKCTKLAILYVRSCINMNVLTHKFTWNMCLFNRPEGWRKWNGSVSVKRWTCWSACSIQTLSVFTTPGSPQWKGKSALSLWRNSWRQGRWRRKFSLCIDVQNYYKTTCRWSGH